jgi:hypothetical protein
MSRSRAALWGLLSMSVMLAGCSAGSLPNAEPFTPSPRSSPTQSALPPQPTNLVGMWRVTGPASASGDAWVRFDVRRIESQVLGQELTLWRDCGAVGGAWRATSTVLVSDMYFSYGEECTVPGALGADWLNNVSYVRTDGGIEVRDSGGALLATLVNDGSSPPEDTVHGLTAAIPKLTSEETASFAPGVPLPTTAEPATDIVGRWIAADATSTSPDQPFVAFHADGTYTGSDGCNGAGGGWALGEGGEFVATMGASTLIGCDGVGIPGWVTSASRLGLELGETDAPVLTLFDRKGNTLGRLVSG